MCKLRVRQWVSWSCEHESFIANLRRAANTHHSTIIYTVNYTQVHLHIFTAHGLDRKPRGTLTTGHKTKNETQRLKQKTKLTIPNWCWKIDTLWRCGVHLKAERDEKWIVNGKLFYTFMTRWLKKLRWILLVHLGLNNLYSSSGSFGINELKKVNKIYRYWGPTLQKSLNDTLSSNAKIRDWVQETCLRFYQAVLWSWHSPRLALPNLFLTKTIITIAEILGTPTQQQKKRQ